MNRAQCTLLPRLAVTLYDQGYGDFKARLFEHTSGTCVGGFQWVGQPFLGDSFWMNPLN